MSAPDLNEVVGKIVSVRQRVMAKTGRRPAIHVTVTAEARDDLLRRAVEGVRSGAVKPNEIFGASMSVLPNQAVAYKVWVEA